MITEELRRRLVDFTRVDRVLIASDYDGTLAAIVEDPAQAWPLADSISALTELALLVDTAVAVISGRSLDELERLSGLMAPVHLVGSHGTEFADHRFVASVGAATLLDERELRELADIGALIAAAVPGVVLEYKPQGVALHYRRVEPARRDEVIEQLQRALARERWAEAISVRHGKFVVEALAAAGDKGTALIALRDQLDVDAVMFIGDDVTDEDAFGVLGAGDIGVKVGPGDTGAAYRVDDVHEVCALVGHTAALRSTSR